MDIDHFAVHDGPGIRTCLFLKGCPLTCLWCHSPESQLREPQILFAQNRCVKCGLCAAACENYGQILDEEGSMTLPVQGGTRLSENYVGAAFDDYDSYLVLSHFKGHSMAGYGGAIKNISIGLGSSEGKAWIHSAGSSRTNPWGGDQDAFLESMAEAGKSVSDYLGDQIVYINVMNRLSVDCDCDGNPAEPDMHDIGILASTDPVALDQACIDLVYSAEDGQSLVNRIESRNGLHTLEHAQQIGLGSRSYELVSIDG